jgi:hypothetical protein
MRAPKTGEVWYHKRKGYSVNVIRVGSTVEVRDENFQSFEFTRCEFEQSFRPRQ